MAGTVPNKIRSAGVSAPIDASARLADGEMWQNDMAGRRTDVTMGALTPGVAGSEFCLVGTALSKSMVGNDFGGHNVKML